MNRLKYSACAFAALLFSLPAQAKVTYNWIIYNNFYLYGNNIKQLEPPVCTGMTCPTIAPDSVPYQTYATASAEVTGDKPNGEVFIGFLWGDGVSKNECGFALSGGTVNSDGTSTAPTAFSYLTKYTQNGSTIYPGCRQDLAYVTASCDTDKKNCVYTGHFQIDQTR